MAFALPMDLLQIAGLMNEMGEPCTVCYEQFAFTDGVKHLVESVAATDTQPAKKVCILCSRLLSEHRKLFVGDGRVVSLTGTKRGRAMTRSDVDRLVKRPRNYGPDTDPPEVTDVAGRPFDYMRGLVAADKARAACIEAAVAGRVALKGGGSGGPARASARDTAAAARDAADAADGAGGGGGSSASVATAAASGQASRAVDGEQVVAIDFFPEEELRFKDARGVQLRLWERADGIGLLLEVISGAWEREFRPIEAATGGKVQVFFSVFKEAVSAWAADADRMPRDGDAVVRLSRAVRLGDAEGAEALYKALFLNKVRERTKLKVEEFKTISKAAGAAKSADRVCDGAGGGSGGAPTAGAGGAVVAPVPAAPAAAGLHPPAVYALPPLGWPMVLGAGAGAGGGGGGRGAGGGRGGQPKVCFGCGQAGHIRSACPSAGGGGGAAAAAAAAAARAAGGGSAAGAPP